MKSKISNLNRLFEYRIKYNAGAEHCVIDNYRYYMAESSTQALEFHMCSIKMKQHTVQNVSVERFNPWNKRWEDKSEVLDQS